MQETVENTKCLIVYCPLAFSRDFSWF